MCIRHFLCKVTNNDSISSSEYSTIWMSTICIKCFANSDNITSFVTISFRLFVVLRTVIAAPGKHKNSIINIRTVLQYCFMTSWYHYWQCISERIRDNISFINTLVLYIIFSNCWLFLCNIRFINNKINYIIF